MLDNLFSSHGISHEKLGSCTLYIVDGQADFGTAGGKGRGAAFRTPRLHYQHFKVFGLLDALQMSIQRGDLDQSVLTDPGAFDLPGAYQSSKVLGVIAGVFGSILDR
jgi:hypothetical protein